MNIISNAVKYNRVGGEIRLGCCEKPSADPETAQIEFTCADTGIGMSEEFQKHVFEPFAQERNTARSEYGGTGLGMPIAKSLAEKMGGTLSFVSRQGVGTTFTLSLPFRICHAPEKRNKPKRLLQTSSIAGLHVLVAEDNRMNMEIAEFVLNVEEAFIIKAVNGEEAVRIFADSRPGEIDAILMDVMMPGDGRSGSDAAYSCDEASGCENHSNHRHDSKRFRRGPSACLCCGHGYAYCKAAGRLGDGGNAGAVCQILAEIGAEAQKGYYIKESQPKTADFSCIVQFCCPQHTYSGTIRQDGKLTSAVPSQAGGRNAVWRGLSAHGWPRG